MNARPLFKKTGFWFLILTVLFIVSSFWGVLVRNAVFTSEDEFPSWTYSSKLAPLNVWTSWDSGFYYDIAQNGYPVQKDFVSVTQITVPAKSWIKIFTGYMQIGETRFALPSERAKINNVVFLMGHPNESKTVLLYSVKPGTPYCIYTGPIDFERDVLVHTDSFSNPTACGVTPCDKTYLTYYDVAASQVMYQEYFDANFLDKPRVSLGVSRPFGFDINYQGYGCKSISESDIKLEQDISFKRTFTSFPFAFLYPYLARAGSIILKDVVLAGVVLSFLCALLSCLFLYLFAREYLDVKQSMYATVAYMFFPTFFFNFTFQPISLIAMLFFANLYFLAKGKVLMAGISMLLLVLAGPYFLGLVLLVPLFFVSKKNFFMWLANLFAVCFGIVARAVYVYLCTDDLFTLFKSYAPWFGGTFNPIGGFINYFSSLDIYKAFEVSAFLLVFLIAVWPLLKKNTQGGNDALNEGAGEKVRDGLLLGSFSLEVARSFLFSFALFPLFNGGFGGTLKYYFLLIPLFLNLGVTLEKSKLKTVLSVTFFMLLSFVLMSLWTVSSRFVM